MTRATILAAALAAGIALPAFAADNASPPAFTQNQARQHLMHLGFTNVSELQKDTHGNWAGTAVNKDGKTVPVAVGLKGPTSTN
jgi:peptidase YpeB-like protein